MTQQQIEIFEQVLKNNTDWALIVEGITAKDVNSAIVIPATIPTEVLGITISENGIKYPEWLTKLKIVASSLKNAYLVIENIDSVSAEEQEKFYGLIKYKAVNGVKLPTNTQIILTAKNANNISKKISSLAILHKVA